MKREKSYPMSLGAIWPLEGHFGLFKPKPVGLVPLRPLQTLNLPKLILFWNFFSTWPFKEPSRIYQFVPNKV